MTSLIIGGTGNTGLPLAKLLHGAGHSVLVTSRSGKAPEPLKAVAFDWTDPSTFENPFKADPLIDRLYFIPPNAQDSLAIVKLFVEKAIAHNVKKFVMLATSLTTPGGAFGGDIYQYFLDSPLDYVILRPNWFMQNFATQFVTTIKTMNFYSTASTGGKAIFVSTDDIAQAAFEALTTDKYLREAPFVFGPQALTSAEMANTFSTVLGREIIHKSMPAEQRQSLFESFGLPAQNAKALVDGELGMADGAEEKVFLDPQVPKHIGKVTFKEFVEANAALWK
ncbi:hypothetical protein BJ165DRAFT_1391823 [Panaeolus papilionaceus]|nr:hypothetical protein BJ165DRAFT_1391823 [Panaeolus papilionaceus]